MLNTNTNTKADTNRHNTHTKTNANTNTNINISTPTNANNNYVRLVNNVSIHTTQKAYIHLVMYTNTNTYSTILKYQYINTIMY